MPLLRQIHVFLSDDLAIERAYAHRIVLVAGFRSISEPVCCLGRSIGSAVKYYIHLLFTELVANK